MLKLIAAGASSLLGLLLAAAYPPPDRPEDPPPPPKAKKKGEPGPRGPAGDLRKAYDLLRRVRSDNRSVGRPEERLRDWTDRATRLYRDGVRAFDENDSRLAHEYGIAAHDLARAVDHARNASLYEGRDSELPPPPDAGPEGDQGRVRHDLRRAYDRIRDGGDEWAGREAQFYLDAARDLYNAARRDAVAGRVERAGELARAAEAMTHVPEHLAHAADRDGPKGKRPPRPFDDRPEPKAKGERSEPKRPPRPEPAREGFDEDLPPPL